jgi:hypothetical protein
MKKNLLIVPCLLLICGFNYNPEITIWGDYSSQLRTKCDAAEEAIENNFILFAKDKNPVFLKNNMQIIKDTRQEIETTIDRTSDVYISVCGSEFEDANASKPDFTQAGLDKYEAKVIKRTVLPYLCESLYKTGEMLANAGDKDTAKKAFRMIVVDYNLPISASLTSCNRKAEFAL